MAQHISPLSKAMSGSSAQTQTKARGIVFLCLLLAGIIGVVALASLAFAARTTPYFDYDLYLTRAVQSITAPGYDALMRAVGEPGYPPQVYIWVAFMIVVFFAAGLKWEALTQIFATVGIGVVGLLIKMWVSRPRPDPNLVHVVNPALDGGKYSFPAGHVQSYMAIIGFLLFLSIILRHRYAWMRVVEIFGYAFFLVFIGVSRVYTGEHWASDVLGAYILGTLWLMLTIVFYAWGKPRFFVRRAKRENRKS